MSVSRLVGGPLSLAACDSGKALPRHRTVRRPRNPRPEYAAEFIALHLTSPRCSLQLMDMLPGGQMNFPPRARQAPQTFAADQVHQCGLAPT
jgi:hypothetical protein